MSVEISRDILAVSEKCRWKFPATIKLCEKNVGGNFQRHFGCERKMSVEFFFQLFNSIFFLFYETSGKVHGPCTFYKT